MIDHFLNGTGVRMDMGDGCDYVVSDASIRNNDNSIGI